MDAGGMTTYLSSLTGQTFDGDNYYALLTLDYSKIADSPSKTIALQLVEYYHTHWLQESYNPLTYYRALGLFREAAEEAERRISAPSLSLVASGGMNFPEETSPKRTAMNYPIIRRCSSLTIWLSSMDLMLCLKPFLRMKIFLKALA